MSEQSDDYVGWGEKQRTKRKHRVFLLLFIAKILILIAIAVVVLIYWPKQIQSPQEEEDVVVADPMAYHSLEHDSSSSHLSMSILRRGGSYHEPCEEDKDCDAQSGFTCSAVSKLCDCVLPDEESISSHHHPLIKVVKGKCTIQVSERDYDLFQGFCGKREIVSNNHRHKIYHACVEGENRKCVNSHCSCAQGFRESHDKPFCYKELTNTKIPCIEDRECTSIIEGACINGTCQKCTLGSFTSLPRRDFRCVQKFGDHCKKEVVLGDVGRIDLRKNRAWISAHCGGEEETGMICHEASTYDKRRIHMCGCTTTEQTFDKERQRCVAV